MNNINIFYCGKQKCEKGHFFGPAVRPHFMLHFIINGKGLYKVHNKEYHLEQGMAFLIRPEEITYYEADEEEPWEYAWIAFDGEDANELLNNLESVYDGYVFEFHDSKMVSYFFQELLEKGFKSSKYENSLEWIGFFYLLIGKINIKSERTTCKVDKSYLNCACEYIRNNYSLEIQINEICLYVGIERSYLFRIFKKYQGISPKEYLTNYRILAAKDMLKNTKYSTTEIALSCGFHDASSFCKTFLKNTNMTPQNYRKRPLVKRAL